MHQILNKCSNENQLPKSTNLNPNPRISHTLNIPSLLPIKTIASIGYVAPKLILHDAFPPEDPLQQLHMFGLDASLKSIALSAVQLFQCGEDDTLTLDLMRLIKFVSERIRYGG